MPSILSSMETFTRKALRIAAVGAIATMLIPMSASAQPAAEPFDLPITLLQPADVAQAGFDDYGLVMGWTANNENLAYDMINRQGYEEDVARQGVEDSGMGTIYFQSLHPIAEPSDGQLVGIAIETSITAFSDTEHAEHGLDFMRRVGEDDLLPNPPSIGDYAEISETDYAAGEVSELPLNEVDVVMRFDNLVANFSLLGYDTDVEQTDAVALAQIFGDKIEAMMNGEKVGSAYAPELSLMAPTYFSLDACVCRMQYTVVGGVAAFLSARCSGGPASARHRVRHDIAVLSARPFHGRRRQRRHRSFDVCPRFEVCDRQRRRPLCGRFARVGRGRLSEHPDALHQWGRG